MLCDVYFFEKKRFSNRVKGSQCELSGYGEGDRTLAPEWGCFLSPSLRMTKLSDLCSYPKLSKLICSGATPRLSSIVMAAADMGPGPHM